jgi:ABC-type oligopeptide transport system substrate-binding subunit
MPRPQLANVELRAAVHPIFTSGYAGCAAALLKAFNDVGVKIRPVTQTMDQFLAAVRDGTADLSVGRWIADYPDADTFAYVLHSTGGFLGRYCGTPEIDRLLAQGRSETDPDARHTIYRRIEEIIARDALLLPLFHEQSYRFARPDVEGLTVSAFMPTVAYEQLTVRAD